MHKIVTLMFHDTARGCHTLFSKGCKLKAMSCLVSDGASHILFTVGAAEIKSCVVKVTNFARFLHLLKLRNYFTSVLVLQINEPVRKIWKPLIAFSCNEMSRMLGSIDCGFCLNPQIMYNKIKRLDGERNFNILLEWSKYGTS